MQFLNQYSPAVGVPDSLQQLENNARELGKSDPLHKEPSLKGEKTSKLRRLQESRDASPTASPIWQYLRGRKVIKGKDCQVWTASVQLANGRKWARPINLLLPLEVAPEADPRYQRVADPNLEEEGQKRQQQ
ncbi:unnamed protein product [Gongylonema pulchrum]|uniref:DUF5641 domain-containing protein n=1 Tax=Gongylonema pulchrum TaxID=637853 RepID=A0A183DXM1_9BILA|nr:unnamed protein product [Gongylonema pulchrum]